MKTRFASAFLIAGALSWSQSAAAQLIPVKTIPVAESEQFAFFPTAGRTTMSMVLVDSLLDPFSNPAKGSMIRRSQFFGAPSFFSVTGNAGGGTTFPMGGLLRRGSSFLGLALAFQEIDRTSEPGFFGPLIDPVTGFVTTQAQAQPSHSNRYAYAMFGHTLDSARTSLGGSVMLSDLHSVDGTDQFYDGNTSLSQLGDAVDMRLGVTRRMRNGRSIEAMLLHNRFATEHEVGFVDFFWDPASRATRSRSRTETNAERTNVWGMHVEYEHPLDSGWRVGALATTNLVRHPRIPSYMVTSGLGSTGRATAFNVGIGGGRVTKFAAFGVDAIYEPITNTSWIVDTVDNDFRFNNMKLRGGASRDFPMLTPGNYVRVQLGAEFHWINYDLRQADHINSVTRREKESWLERGRSGGVSFVTPGLQMHYLVTTKNGVGRPGVRNDNGVIFASPLVSSSVWGGAPSTAPVGLGAVAVTRHVFSVSVPVR